MEEPSRCPLSCQENGKPATLASLLPLIHSKEAVQLTAECAKAKCVQTIKTTDVHVAGISCRPFAPCGAQEGTASWEMSALGAWGGLMVKLEPKTIMVEQSHRFQVVILQSIFGSRYVWQVMILNGTDFGMKIRRKRFYAVGHHQEKVGEAICRMDNVIPLLYRDAGYNCTYRDYMIAESMPEFEHEKDEELAWAIARPKSKAKGKTLDEVKTLHHPYDLALTQVETTNLAKYEADLPRGISCNIVQSFDKRPTYGTVDTMHTIVANMGLHFCTSSSVRRWFTTSELMVAQGIPIHRSFANPRGRHYTTTPYLMPANRKRIKVLQQIGNTMQIPVVGTVLFYLILFTQW